MAFLLLFFFFKVAFLYCINYFKINSLQNDHFNSIMVHYNASFEIDVKE